ncbi:hypothetical protein PFISCL1PPCAC_12541, partial [Pristionchus fissidentatus]
FYSNRFRRRLRVSRSQGGALIWPEDRANGGIRHEGQRAGQCEGLGPVEDDHRRTEHHARLSRRASERASASGRRLPTRRRRDRSKVRT